MNSDDKTNIIRFRAAGMGYKRIASELSLSVNSVKSFCQRNEIIRVGADRNTNDPSSITAHSLQSKENPSACKQCGVHVTQAAGRKEKRFCCDAYRVKWWRAHKALMNHRTANARSCPECGATFYVAANDPRKYCDRSCYLKHRYREAHWT